MSTRWYLNQMECLPSESRRRLSLHLRRHLRNGTPPSRREWRLTVEQAFGRYRPDMA